MEPQEDNDPERLRKVAESIDCMIDDDFRLLCDITPCTEQAWQKRGTGPSYIRAGNRCLYPRQAVTEFLQSKLRERRASPTAGVL